MTCPILKCVMFFHIVVAVPLTNDHKSREFAEEENVRMASPSYIRSLEKPPGDSSVGHTIYNVPIQTNFNSNHRDITQFAPPKEAAVSDIRYLSYQNNQDLSLKEVKLPPSQRNQENQFETKHTQNPYQNINENNWQSPQFQKEINSQIEQNVNRQSVHNIQKPFISLQTWRKLYEGSPTLQNLLSNPNSVRNILVPVPQKEFIVVYPNGTISHEDNLDTIANKYPNHIVMSSSDIQELSNVNSQNRFFTYKQPQQNSQDNISSFVSGNSNNIHNNPSSFAPRENHLQSFLPKTEIGPKHFDASSHTTTINNANNSMPVTLKTTSDSDIASSKSSVSSLSKSSLPLSSVTKQQELNKESNLNNLSNSTQNRTIKLAAKQKNPDDINAGEEKELTPQEPRIKGLKTHEDKPYNNNTKKLNPFESINSEISPIELSKHKDLNINSQDIISSIVTGNFKNIHNNPISFAPHEAHLQSNLPKTEIGSKHFDASSHTTTINNANNSKPVTLKTTSDYDIAGLKSSVFNLSKSSLPLSSVTKQQGLNKESNLNSLSNSTQNRTIKIAAKQQNPDDINAGKEKDLTPQEPRIKSLETHEDKQYNNNPKKLNPLESINREISPIELSKYKDLNTNTGKEETKNIQITSLVNDTVGNNTKSLNKAEIGATNIANNTNNVNFTEMKYESSTEFPEFTNYKNDLQNDATKTDISIDNIYRNVTDPKNTTVITNDANDLSNTELRHTTTELPENINTINTNNRLLNDDIQHNTTTNDMNEMLFNDTYNNDDDDNNATIITEADDMFELNSNETEDTITDTKFSNVDSFDDSLGENEKNDESLVHCDDYEDEINEEDDVSTNLEIDDGKSAPWIKTNKENIAKILFGDGNENQNIFFTFYTPPETAVEKETKTTIHSNGTIVEEYIETRNSPDGGPRIKIMITKTYNVGVDSNTSNCSSTTNNG